ncbi:hypothetical protein NPX13_g9020 [Xylaria arbuscula]|uniref:Clr5 domain-containing protein n=1 Tax=Xylaria arbuscula TaxID=114810 RepID=A0A9W8TIW7_9PEZI|nr:hypothetical protein NPX13_g9020 [Xylaria arbuscula]
MSAGRSKPSEEQWLRHQALIHRLYIVEEKPLRHIVDELRGLGFIVTPSQLEYKVKKWNFKRNISKETWVEIDHCIRKRKREGKDSEVILCGKRLKLETVEKETDRYRDRSIFAQFKSEPNGSLMITTNTQVSVSTPPSFSVEIEWPSTLPWFRFPQSEMKIMLKRHLGITRGAQKIQREALIPVLFHQGMTGPMNTVQFGASKLAAVIGAWMPESYPQESLRRVHSFVNGSQQDFLLEAVSMLAYMLSNNLFELSHEVPNNRNEDEWRKIMTILKTSGLFEIRINLKTLNSHTINGFMENLYYAAISRMCYTEGTADDTENMALLQWLLAVGQTPTLPHQKIFWYSSGPIGRPAGLELVNRLLEAGANANTWIFGGITVLCLTIIQRNMSNSMVYQIAKLLLEHGASDMLDVSLHAAIRRRVMDPALIEIIIHHGGNLLTGLDNTCEFLWGWEPREESDYTGGDESKWEVADILIYSHTALSVAALAGLLQTQYVLDLLTSRNPSKSITDFVTADVLISAVISEEFDTICLL